MAQSIAFDVIARDKASSTFSKIGRSSDSTKKRLVGFGKTAGLALGFVGVGAGLISFLKNSTTEAREAQKAGALTNQVIKSTGGVANVSAKHIESLATAISNKVGIDDEAIQSGENLLLTFKGIRNEAGRGNKIFDQATQAAIDLGAGLAAASGGQVNFRSATTLVGKALNDPIRGLTSLRRVGVQFTKGQEDQIKKLVESGKTMKAQKVILRELKSQFGGAGASQATAADKAKVAWKNLEEQIGTALLPTIDKLATFTSGKVVPAISKFVTGMRDGTGAGGKLADILGDAAAVGKTALAIFEAIPGPIKKFGIEGLIAYGVIRKLSGVTAGFGASLAGPIAKVKQMNAEMSYTATRTQRVTVAARAMGGMLRNVAGAGGMLLLADGAGKAGTKMGLLESAAGGALSGAALGAFAGPPGAAVGAAIGGLAGGALALFRNTKSAGDAASQAIGKWQDYAATLDQVTGATTEATRALARKKAEDADILKTTRAAGIADRDVVNAIVNGGRARDRVIAGIRREVAAVDTSIAAKKRELAANIATANDMSVPLAQQTAAANRVKANRDELAALEELRKTRKKDADEVLAGLGAVQKSIDETQKNAAAVRDLTGKLKGLPKSAKTQIKADGIIPTTKGITKLAEKYHLTPKQIKTVVAAAGVPLTKGQIQALIDTVKAYGKLNPKPRIDADTGPARAKLNGIKSYLNSIISTPWNIPVTVSQPQRPGRHPRGSGEGGRVVSGPSDRIIRDAGRSTTTAYADGIHLGAMKVKNALEKLQTMVTAAVAKVSRLKEIKAGFLSTFSSDSIFGADLTEPGSGISSLIAMQQKQAQQAQQLMADIQRVASMGLSKSLIKQLQSQGTSGADALHALASGSLGQIQQLNALNAQTQSSLQAAGLFAGNKVRGGNITSDIARAAREEHLIERLIKRLHHMDEEIVIEIDGEAIVRAIKRRNKRKGVRTADL